MLGLWACVELINCWAMPALRQVWAMPHCLLVLPRVPELPPCCPRRFIQHPFRLALLAPQRIQLSGSKLYTLKIQPRERNQLLRKQHVLLTFCPLLPQPPPQLQYPILSTQLLLPKRQMLPWPIDFFGLTALGAPSLSQLSKRSTRANAPSREASVLLTVARAAASSLD